MPTTPVPTTLHPRPARGWLNDPNGVVRWQGRWHVFFQHNPDAPRHARIQWGHLSSEDLLAWHEHPVAFGPTPDGPDSYGCWSGVFVTGLDRPAVAYSGVVDESAHSTVCLRYALDDGLETWGPPIVVAQTPDHDGIRVMRDPYVFEHGGRRWALLGAGLDDGRPAVLLFGCDDIEAWTYEGIWLTHDGESPRGLTPSDIWECPQLVSVDGESVLVVSLQLEGRLGDVFGIRGRVETGTDGAPVLVRTGPVELLDAGPAFYAPQVVPDEDGPLLLGWVRQDDVTDGSSPVAGCLTFPRRLRLEQGRLVTAVDPAVEGLATGPSRDLCGPVRADLPPVVRVEVTTVDATGDHAVLQGAASTIGLPLGGTAWVDGEVVEAFPGRTAPAMTIRDLGTSPWTIEVPAGATVRLSELRRPPA